MSYAYWEGFYTSSLRLHFEFVTSFFSLLSCMKPAFNKCICRLCTTGLPSDVVVEVGETSFHLHKVCFSWSSLNFIVWRSPTCFSFPVFMYLNFCSSVYWWYTCIYLCMHFCILVHWYMLNCFFPPIPTGISCSFHCFLEVG